MKVSHEPDSLLCKSMKSKYGLSDKGWDTPVKVKSSSKSPWRRVDDSQNNSVSWNFSFFRNLTMRVG